MENEQAILEGEFVGSLIDHVSPLVLECYKTQISEYEWRLNITAEDGIKNESS